MGVAGSLEKLVPTYHTAQHHIPGDCYNHKIHHCESHKALTYLIAATETEV
jgi:hypothetical protein